MNSGKIVNLLIAVILFVSTSGVVINKHYSGGELFSTAIFVAAESCCSESCCHQPMNGCSEEKDYYRLTTDYVIPANSVSNSFELINYTTFSYTTGLFDPELNSIAFGQKIGLQIIKPPPKLIDIPVFFHSLLI